MTDLNASNRTLLLRGSLVADAHTVLAEPGVVLLRYGRIVAAGRPEAVGRLEGAEIVECPGEAILPALANAHTHLDLSHVGPIPAGDSFDAWLRQVLGLRRHDAAGIEASVREGIRLSRAGGVAAVGDIAGAWSTVPLRTLGRSPLRGVGFIEGFGLGTRQSTALERWKEVVGAHGRDSIARSGGLDLGLQPHAPYSCGLALYQAVAALAVERGLPLATHLAETPEEIEFALHRSGPFAEFLSGMGLLDDSVLPLGGHPLDVLVSAGVFSQGRWLLVHLNCIEARHVDLLAGLGATVVYCPRASAYFGHPRPGWSPHLYREMLAAGVPVVLGTDSILCLDTPDRISPLDDARLLWSRDGGDARSLLAMITTAPATALGLDPRRFALRPGETAGLLGVRMTGPGLEGVLRSTSAPRWLHSGTGATSQR